MEHTGLHNQQKAGCLRRLMASIYDWLLVIAVMMLLSVPVVALLDNAIQPGNNMYRSGLIVIASIFFTAFWSHGGQTLGMKAWRLQLIQTNGSPVNYQKAVLRFIYACISALPMGLGFLWMLWDRDQLSWHDRWTGTTIVLLPKINKSGNTGAVPD
jgi:uncharacterized RDD family membrane protein YckC